jgi:hypothetical protein
MQSDAKPSQSVPLQPVERWGTKLSISMDGQIMQSNRQLRNSFATLMHDRRAYSFCSSSLYHDYHDINAAISRHAIEVTVEMSKPHALTHIGLLGRQARVDLMEVRGGTQIETIDRGRRRALRRSSAVLKTVLNPDDLGWITDFKLCVIPSLRLFRRMILASPSQPFHLPRFKRYCYVEAIADWKYLGSYNANDNSCTEKVVSLKSHFNTEAALFTRRLKIVPTSSQGAHPAMRIAL